MKNIFKLLALLAIVIGISSCEKDTVAPDRMLEVTPANIDGIWRLAEWNGQEIDSDTYCYIIFHRKDKTFEMYQKFDSMYARYITGTFYIDHDPRLGYVIGGQYDFGNGEWNNEYIVTSLTEDGTMRWTVKNGDETTTYVRCDEIPSDVTGQAGSEIE